MDRNSTPQLSPEHTTSPPVIAIIGTGGTISCTTDSHGDLTPSLSIADIAEQTGVTDMPTCEIFCFDAMSLDSSALQLEDIDALISEVVTCAETTRAQGKQLAGVVVVHGTDTMEETAMAMDVALGASIPVAITGAQRPADHPQADGPGNLKDAVAHLLEGTQSPATNSATRRPHIVFGGKVLPAVGTTKTHTTADAGFSHEAAESMASFLNTEPTLTRFSGWNVPILDSYAGADGQLVRAMMSAARRGEIPPIDAMVVAGLGSGNIPPLMADALFEAISDTGMPVVVCSRVPEGGVHFVYGGSGGGANLARHGMMSGGNLRPSQARIGLIGYLARTAANENSVED